jgi:hypothetical protein
VRGSGELGQVGEPELDDEDEARDTLRGIVTVEDTDEAEEMAQLADADAETLVRGARRRAEANQRLSTSDRSRDLPYEHPVYWACAVVYGA